MKIVLSSGKCPGKRCAEPGRFRILSDRPDCEQGQIRRRRSRFGAGCKAVQHRAGDAVSFRSSRFDRSVYSGLYKKLLAGLKPGKELFCIYCAGLFTMKAEICLHSVLENVFANGILSSALLCRNADRVRGNMLPVYGIDDVTDRLRYADVRDV